MIHHLLITSGIILEHYHIHRNMGYGRWYSLRGGVWFAWWGLRGYR